jgi:glycosyltransferase involved in cell wall biosynthesis
VAEPGIELVGVRITRDGTGTHESTEFGWPVADLSLGRLSLSTFYRRQKHRLSNLIRQYRPDIVHGQGTDVAGFLAVGCGLPSVVTVHGLLGECAKYQTNPATKARAVLSGLLTERHTVRRATDLIAISPYVTRYYESELRGRVHEVPNAVAPSFFGVRRAPERGRLLFAGRIANGKGLVELLRAVALNQATVTKVVLAGSAPDPAYADFVRKEAELLGLTGRVEFAGLLDEPSLLEEFALAEALVLPSYQETAPMVIQQAMAAGLAVLATNVGGVPFQIQHDVMGLLFGAGDVAQLAGLLGRLGDDPSLSRRLGEAAKIAAVARYDASTVARATIAVYQSILSSAQAHASQRFSR